MSEMSSPKSGTGYEEEKRNTRVKITRTLKDLQFKNPGSRFTADVQGKRKVKQAVNHFDYLSKPIYSETGILLANGQDICDCLRKDCPGCHFPCKKCTSLKCGSVCRCNRTWYFEKIEIEGLSKTLEMTID